MTFSDLAARVARGYARLLRSVAEVVLVFAGMAGLAFAVVFPLWWLAVHRRELYTALIAGSFLTAALLLALRRMRAGGREDPGVSKCGSRIRRILARLLLGVGAYGTGVLILRAPILGIAAALILLAGAGILAFGRGERSDRGR